MLVLATISVPLSTLIAAERFALAPRDVRAQLVGVPNAGIVVATLDDGRTAIRSYGETFNGNSRFEIGSITKTFTATLFADMIIRHEVDPNDPIEKFFPTGTKVPSYGGRSITLADLATQTSGLPRMPTNFVSVHSDDPYDYDETKLLAFLGTYTLLRAPGATYEYSNLGFGLLGTLLARRLGVDYATAIQSRILQPLGMRDTAISSVGTTIATVPGHDADGDPVSNWHFAALAGAGAIVSTPNDMLRFARANLEAPQGVLGAAMALAQRPLRQAGGRRIGYAWMTDPDGIVWHNGGTGGFRTFLGLDREHRRAVFVAANAFLEAVDALGQHTLDPAFALPAAFPNDVKVDRRDLALDVGSYHFSDGSIAIVTLDDRGLIVMFSEAGFRARLHPTSATTFIFHEYATASIRLERSSDGMVMIVSQAGAPPQIGRRNP